VRAASNSLPYELLGDKGSQSMHVKVRAPAELSAAILDNRTMVLNNQYLISSIHNGEPDSMPRRKQLAITERQFEVLSLLWEHGAMTVRDLLDRLDRDHPLPYTTVLGLLQNMERAGLATHEVENQTHRYCASLSREEATGTLLTDFVTRFFRGSAERLVLGLVTADQLSADDLRQIEAQLIQNSQRQPKPRRGQKPSSRAAKKSPSKPKRRKS
jgi:predicted transcriptional regulator